MMSIYKQKGWNIILPVIVFVAAMSLIFLIKENKIKEKQEVQMQEIEENANDLQFYMDGVSVEYENLGDLSRYEIEYKPDEGKVLLKKVNQSLFSFN